MKTLALNHILNKSKNKITRKDILSVISEQDITKITFHYIGIDSKLKELKIPINDIDHAERVLAEGERVDGSSLFKGLIDASVSDLYVVPLYKSAFINPFDSKSINFICHFLDRNGESASYGLGSILQRAHNLLKKNTGFELYALGELEFFLLGEQTSKLFPSKNLVVFRPKIAAKFPSQTTTIKELITRCDFIIGWPSRSKIFWSSHIGSVNGVHCGSAL